MNWPQASYGSSSGGGAQNSLFGGQQQHSSSSSSLAASAGGGFGTPQQQQQQQQGYNGAGQQQHFGTANNTYNNGQPQPFSGFQGPASTFQQHTFSTSSPLHQHGANTLQQQQQQQQQPNGMPHASNGMIGFQSSYGPQAGQFGGSAGQQQHGGGQMMQQGSNAGSYGQYGQQPAYIGGTYGSPQVAGSQPGGSNAQSGTPSVGRYLPGYLTASSLSGSPRQSTSNTTHDGRLSPEQQHREAAGSFGAGSSRLFGSSTSSAGTAGRESPSRSPKQSLFSSSAYGSSRTLALTPASGSRTRRTSNNALVRSSHDDYMEEDAPPIDTLDEFDNDAGVPYVASPAPHAHYAPSASAGGAMSPSKRSQTLALPSAGQSNSAGIPAQGNGTSSNLYKVVAFGFAPNQQASVLSEFASIAPLVYNSLQHASPSGRNDITGSNWFTIGYESEWSALRALRRNGEVSADGSMIGVKWANDSRMPENGAAESALVPSQQATPASSLPRSSTVSNLGTPAKVLPASQAFLPKQNHNSNAVRKSTTMNRINDMGKIDPSIFKEPAQPQQKQGGGVVGTLTNLIFGF